MESVQWEDHSTDLFGSLGKLYQNDELIDCMFETHGGLLKGHKAVLAACSPLLKKMFIGHQGMLTISLKKIKYHDLKHILDFIYFGEVDVPLINMASFMKTAQALQIAPLKRFLSPNFSVKFSNSDARKSNNRIVSRVNFKKDTEQSLSSRGTWRTSEKEDRLSSHRDNINSRITHSVGAAKSKEINVLNQVAQRENHPECEVSIINNSGIEKDIANKDCGRLEEHENSFSFVAINPIVRERGDQSVSCFDSSLENSLEVSSNNIEMVKRRNLEGKQLVETESRIKIEIADMDVSDADSQYSDNMSLPEAVESSSSAIENLLCDYEISDRQTNQNLSPDKTVSVSRSVGRSDDLIISGSLITQLDTIVGIITASFGNRYAIQWLPRTNVDVIGAVNVFHDSEIEIEAMHNCVDERLNSNFELFADIVSEIKLSDITDVVIINGKQYLVNDEKEFLIASSKFGYNIVSNVRYIETNDKLTSGTRVYNTLGSICSIITKKSGRYYGLSNGENMTKIDNSISIICIGLDCLEIRLEDSSYYFYGKELNENCYPIRGGVICIPGVYPLSAYSETEIKLASSLEIVEMKNREASSTNKTFIRCLMAESRGNRLQEVRNNKKFSNTVTDAVFYKYPHLRSYDGEMIDDEFRFLYPEHADKFLTTFSSYFAPRILKIAQAKSTLLVESLRGIEYNLKALIVLPELLPQPKAGRREAKRSRNFQPRNLYEERMFRSNEPLIPHPCLLKFVPSDVDVNVASTPATNQKQPFLVCVTNDGDRCGPFFIRFDSVLFPVGSNSVTAFDRLFKLQFMFDIEYAQPLLNFYNFIESCVYRGLGTPKCCTDILHTQIINVQLPIDLEN